MTMIDLTIKIRTNRPVSEVWAALEPVAGNVENITMSAEKVTRSYTKRKPKPKKINPAGHDPECSNELFPNDIARGATASRGNSSPNQG